MLETKLRETLAANQVAVAHALDPVAEGGGVARFLTALRLELDKADNDRNKQLALATKALDANDENSLLSRLMRETAAAKNAFVAAMNPELPNSPMAMIKTTLSTLLEQHVKTQQEAMALMHERQTKFEKDVRDSLVRLEERKRGEAKSTQGGRRFEDQVCLFTHNVFAGVPVSVEDTGNTVGARSGCKVGDQTVTFNGESIYAGSTIVIEAKREANMTMAKALAELEIARSNRTAQAGVFVLAKSHAPPGFPGFSRCGNDVIVVWDDGDEMTDAYLQAAIYLAIGLATRQKRGQDEGNINALADVEQKIEKEIKRNAKMRDLVEAIQKKAEDLADELRKGTKGLGVLVRDAKATLKALNVELASAEEERAEPLSMPAGDLTSVRASLAAQESAAE